MSLSLALLSGFSAIGSVIGAPTVIGNETPGIYDNGLVGRRMDGYSVLLVTTNEASGFGHTDLEVFIVDANGEPGIAFEVSAEPGVSETDPILAVADDSFVVGWIRREDGGPSSFWVRRFLASGLPAGAATELIPENKSFYGNHPRLAATPTGEFAVAWQAFSESGPVLRITRIAASASAPGAITEVPFDGDNQLSAIGLQQDGGLIVLESDSSTGLVQGTLYRLAPGATELGASVPLNATPTSLHLSPTLSMADDGAVTVGWQEWSTPGGPNLVPLVRRFDASLVPLTGEMNLFGSGDSLTLSNLFVAGDADGDFVAAWSLSNDLNEDVFVRQFTSGGLPHGSAIALGSGDESDQFATAVSMDADGDVSVAYVVYGDGGHVVMQRMVGPEPIDLALSAAAVPSFEAAARIMHSFTLTNGHAAAGRNIGGVSSATVMIEPVSAGQTILEPAGEGWTCLANGSGYSCTVGPIVAGAQAQLSVSADVQGTAESYGVRASLVGSGYFDPAAGNDQVTSTALRLLEPDAAVTLTGPMSVRKGKVATLPFTVRNLGNQSASNVRVTINTPTNASIDKVTKFVLAGATCPKVKRPPVTCTIPQLAPGATLAGSIRVKAKKEGSLSQTIGVSASDDGDASNNLATVSVVVTKK